MHLEGNGGGSAGGACANTSRLQGYVGGTLISVNASNNPAYGKTAFISFAVPAGTSYQITSYPTENTSCGAGVFSVFGISNLIERYTRRNTTCLMLGICNHLREPAGLSTRSSSGHPLRCPFWQWHRSRIAPDNLWWKAE